MSAHEQLASARAALDAAEERASDRRTEARSLREELDSAQAELRRRGTDAELQEHDATLRQSDAQQRQAMCVLCKNIPVHRQNAKYILCMALSTEEERVRCVIFLFF